MMMSRVVYLVYESRTRPMEGVCECLYLLTSFPSFVTDELEGDR